MTPTIDRRRFLEALLVSSAAAGTGLAFSACGMRDANDGRPAAELFPDFDAVRRLGELYRAAGPDPAHLAELDRLLAAAEADGAASWQGLGAELQRRVERDFSAGRVVELEGWRLSLTEAGMCALLCS